MEMIREAEHTLRILVGDSAALKHLTVTGFVESHIAWLPFSSELKHASSKHRTHWVKLTASCEIAVRLILETSFVISRSAG
jgi:16S rRNA C1402 (ribose-2'-O) methylase RsmI